MPFRFNSEVRILPDLSTASTNLIAQFDVSSYETFALQFQNNYTAVAAQGIVVQASYDPSANIGATAAPGWVTLTTASVPFPSSILASAGALTSAIANAYHWIRVLGGVSATASGDVRVRIGGFRSSG